MKEDRKELCADMMPFYVEDFQIQGFWSLSRMEGVPGTNSLTKPKNN